MKKGIKVLSFALATTLALGMSGASAVTAETAVTSPSADEPAAKIYLVPGSYTDANGSTAYNSVADGATKLTDEQCADIHTPNAYALTAQAGEPMPKPSTARDGYAFNGWWTIENATVVYHETVPTVAETTYFYADWRTALSQPMSPINPPEDAEEEISYYLEITRAATGKKEKVILYVSATDVPNAEQLGFGGPVQLYNEWFLLQPGDEMQIFVSGLYSKKPTPAPQFVKDQSYAKLEANSVNDTFDYLRIKFPSGEYNNSWPFTSYGTFKNPSYGYVGSKATEEHHFRIYIKFYDRGDVVTMYMERQD